MPFKFRILAASTILARVPSCGSLDLANDSSALESKGAHWSLIFSHWLRPVRLKRLSATVRFLGAISRRQRVCLRRCYLLVVSHLDAREPMAVRARVVSRPERVVTANGASTATRSIHWTRWSSIVRPVHWYSILFAATATAHDQCRSIRTASCLLAPVAFILPLVRRSFDPVQIANHETSYFSPGHLHESDRSCRPGQGMIF